jgi:hypothetical protein
MGRGGNRKSYMMSKGDKYTFQCICKYEFKTRSKKLYDRVTKIHKKNCEIANFIINNNIITKDRVQEFNTVKQPNKEKIITHSQTKYTKVDDIDSIICDLC